MTDRRIVNVVPADAWAVFIVVGADHLRAVRGAGWALFEHGTSLELLIQSDDGLAVPCRGIPTFVGAYPRNEGCMTPQEACSAVELLHRERIRELRVANPPDERADYEGAQERRARATNVLPFTPPSEKQ